MLWGLLPGGTRFGVPPFLEAPIPERISRVRRPGWVDHRSTPRNSGASAVATRTIIHVQPQSGQRTSDSDQRALPGKIRSRDWHLVSTNEFAPGPALRTSNVVSQRPLLRTQSSKRRDHRAERDVFVQGGDGEGHLLCEKERTRCYHQRLDLSRGAHRKCRPLFLRSSAAAVGLLACIVITPRDRAGQWVA